MSKTDKTTALLELTVQGWGRETDNKDVNKVIPHGVKYNDDS